MLDARIETFLCVCRCMNYTRAAEELNMTQPGVSQHIHYLEQQYGCRLLDYDHRRLTLTAAGETLRRAALTMKHDAAQLRERLLEVQRAGRTLRFGATRSIGESLLPDVLAAWMAAHPGDQAECTVGNTRSLLEALDGGAIDFALVEGDFSKEEYDCLLIRWDRLLAVCGGTFPVGRLAGLEDLFSYPLIVRERGSGSREVLEQELRERGWTLAAFHTVSAVNSPQVIKRLLEAGLGVSFLYEAVAAKELAAGTLRALEIPDFSVRHEFNFIWRRGSICGGEYRALFAQLFPSPQPADRIEARDAANPGR